jgi:hypothetical protein
MTQNVSGLGVAKSSSVQNNSGDKSGSISNLKATKSGSGGKESLGDGTPRKSTFYAKAKDDSMFSQMIKKKSMKHEVKKEPPLEMSSDDSSEKSLIDNVRLSVGSSDEVLDSNCSSENFDSPVQNVRRRDNNESLA